jgi:hypothetical protein
MDTSIKHVRLSLESGSRRRQNSEKSGWKPLPRNQPGLLDDLFSNQKSKFG